MRHRFYEKKLSEELKILETPYVKNQLKNLGISYNHTKGLIIDHCHIGHNDFMNYKGLINYLVKFDKEITSGESLDFYFPIHPVKYPD